MKEKILFLDRVDSTNLYAKRHFAELEDGVLVAAGEQTAGMGRQGRRWLSPAGENICASYVMKHVREPYLATAAASLAVLKTLREYDRDSSYYLKWPNDVYCGMDKICGILSEGVLRRGGGGFDGVIAGMGININSTADTLSGAGHAVSLRMRTGSVFSVKKVLSSLAKYLSACYIKYLNTPEQMYSEWKAENLLIGRMLEFETPDGLKFRAELHDLSRTGDAVLLPADGVVRIFSCGDVRIMKDTWKESETK